MFLQRIGRNLVSLLAIYIGVLGWSVVDAAESSTSIVIHMEDVVDADVLIWQLNPELDISDAQQVVQQLDVLTDEELSARYGQPASHKWQSIVTFTSISPGKYFIRQASINKEGKRLSPIVLEVKGKESSIDVIGKNIHPTTPEEPSTSVTGTTGEETTVTTPQTTVTQTTEDHTTTTRIPEIPETGDATLGYICIFGFSLFLLGWIIVHKEQE